VCFDIKPESEVNQALQPDTICQTEYANKCSREFMMYSFYFRTLALRSFSRTVGLIALNALHFDDATAMFDKQCLINNSGILASPTNCSQLFHPCFASCLSSDTLQCPGHVLRRPVDGWLLMHQNCVLTIRIAEFCEHIGLPKCRETLHALVVCMHVWM
jgi:hypothetical protein